MAFRSFVPYIFMVYALLLLFTLATRFPFFPLHNTFLQGSFDAFMVWPGALAFFFFPCLIVLFSSSLGNLKRYSLGTGALVSQTKAYMGTGSNNLFRV